MHISPFVFHLVEVMECLTQIQSIIITFQYHFTYTIEIESISFEWSERRKISSINQYQSYSSLSIHSTQQYDNHHEEHCIQEWLIEVESNLIHQSFNHSYYQILSNDTYRMNLIPFSVWEEKGDLREWMKSASLRFQHILVSKCVQLT